MNSAPTMRAKKPHPKTLVDIFYAVLERDSAKVMLYQQPDGWHPISALDLYKKVVGTARALRNWGIERGDRVAGVRHQPAA